MNSKDKKKVAFWDFDNTVWGAYSADQFLSYLYVSGVFSGPLRDQIQELVIQYSKDEIDYNTLCFRFGGLWGVGFWGLSVQRVNEIAEELVNIEYNNCMHSSTPVLIDLLKEKGYDNIIMSLGPSEVVERVGSRLGVDGIFSAKLTTSNGVYTGSLESTIHYIDGKKNCVRRIKDSGKYDWHRSMALGDSPNDIGMLEMVEIPIILNPTHNIEEVVEQYNWPVFDDENAVEGLRGILS
ncbi:MAG: HAD family phosphatase [Nanoarchaeota archaeon]|nr:HAD family phosphatase [DPANN group archaeon]MBL7116913.1 HAD family phosphatase [Nanoarchaeota archaeon]